MASSMLSSVANGVASAATYTASAVPVILTGTAAVAGAAGNAVVGAVSHSGDVLKYAGSAAKGGAAAGNAVVGAVSRSGDAIKYAGPAAIGVAGATGGAAAGTLAVSTLGTLTLNVAGFTAVGPAAGSYAAAWMSSIAVANGGGVAAGSLYSAVQATAMSGGLLLGAPAVLATGGVVGAVVGVGAVVWKVWH